MQKGGQGEVCKSRALASLQRIAQQSLHAFMASPSALAAGRKSFVWSFVVTAKTMAAAKTLKNGRSFTDMCEMCCY